jgi:hypothetical protein
MKDKVESNEKANIINGVVLTEAAIARLKFFQDYDNEPLESLRDCIANASDLIHMYLPADEYSVEIKNLLVDLSFIRKYLQELRKP